MDKPSCEACTNLQQNAAAFLQQGVTDTVCASLKNNTGLNAAKKHTTEEDLHDVNDCLVGIMKRDIDAYDVCDWKKFMKRFIQNLWSTLKAIICSIGGIFTKIENIENTLANIEVETEDTCGSIWDVLQVALNAADLVAGTIRTNKLTDTTGTTNIFMHVKTRTGVLCGDRIVYDLVGTWISGGWVASGIAVGDILATWTKEQIVPTYMHEPVWNAIMKDGYLQTLCVCGSSQVIYVVLREDAQYPGLMSMRVHSIIGGGSTASGPLATIQNPVKTFVL